MSPLFSVLAIVLLVAPVLPLVTFAVLAAHWRSPSMSLRERTGLALRDTLVSGFVGFVAANRLFGWGISGEALSLAFAVALLLIALPSGVWLLLWYRGSFGGE